MRCKLKNLGVGTRHRFKGTVWKFGIKNTRRGIKETILLKDIYYKGERVADHLWFDFGMQFKTLCLQTKDLVAFDARVNLYRRSSIYNSPQNQIDYTLSNPTKIVKLEKEERKNTMSTNNEFEIINYKSKNNNVAVRFDYENRTVWLTQSEIAEISGLKRQTIATYFKRYENDINFDLQHEKSDIRINNKKVNVYSSKYLQILKQSITNDNVEVFLDWCETIFVTKDYDNYKLVTFSQDNLTLDVRFTNDFETAWLSQDEIAELYGVTRENIAIHIQNIFKQGELEKVSVCKFFLHTASDGKNYPVEHYNLDMILAIGYRVNSKRGIAFRKWASKVLKDYLIKGYAINKKKMITLGKTIEIQNKVITSISQIDYQELSDVINEYAYALQLLDDYDHQSLTKPEGNEATYALTYLEARKIIDDTPFSKTSKLFGVEKEKGQLEGILANINQDVFGRETYPTLEDKAAHLLYFLVKDHPFYDGCKRIAATLFLDFLNKNNALIKKGQFMVSSDALAAITLLTAESSPDEMEIIITVIENVLVKN